MEKRICIICKKEFKPKSFNQYVCNDSHIWKCPQCNCFYTPSSNYIRQFIKTRNIHICKDCSFKNSIIKKKEKYGNGNNSEKIKNTWKNKTNYNIQEMIKKVKQTKLEKYKDENYCNIDKIKQTKLERYGDENYNNRKKAINTLLKRYGTFRTEEQENKRKQSLLNNYRKTK